MISPRNWSPAPVSCQAAGSGGILWFPNGQLVGDRTTGGSAKKILLLVQRNQKLFGQNLLSLRGHARQDVHVGSEVPLGMFFPPAILALLWYCFLSVKFHNNWSHI